MLQQGAAASSKVVLSSLRLLTPRDGELKGFLMKTGLGTASGPKKLILRGLFLALRDAERQSWCVTAPTGQELCVSRWGEAAGSRTCSPRPGDGRSET